MIQNLLNRYKNKEVSVTEITSSYQKRIEELNPTLNAYLDHDPELVKKRSQQLDHELANTKDIAEFFRNKPLFGIPIGIKDLYSSIDFQTTAGSKILDGYKPPYNATVVSKLLNAGAVITGKLNCDAFAHGGSGENSDYKPTRNPYNTEHVPGGSSSGSGAAVAADLCIAAMGTDTGGSIRNPASFTNTVGLKPTYGRVSRYGVIAMASSLDTVGHITNSVEDSAYLYNVTAGYDPLDANTALDPVPNYLESIQGEIKGLKIGIPKEYFSTGIDSEVLSKTRETISVFEKLGAEIVEISLPSTEYALAAYYILTPSEISSNLGRYDGIRFGHDRNSFGDEAKRRIMIGTYVLSAGYYDAYYLRAQKVRTLISIDFKNAFEKVDLLLTPVSPSLPPKIGENVDDPLKMYLMDIFSVTANLAGIPALALPAGFSNNGLPIGVQLLSKHLDEETLFRVGSAYQKVTKFNERKPHL